jgi:hypothetical protein
MIGKIARSKTNHIVPDMPKTRGGKIICSVLAAISNHSNHMDTGDITALANQTSSSKSANKSKAANARQHEKAQPI